MARSQTDGQFSLRGRALAISEAGNLISNNNALTSPCVNATVTVSATSTSPRPIAIALLDAEGNAIDFVETVMIGVFAAADRLAFTTTGGTTGIAIGASGSLLTIVAKKLFLSTSTAGGLIALTHTDTGTDAAAIGVRLGSGLWVMGNRVITIGT